MKTGQAKSLVILLHEIYGANNHMDFMKDVMTQEGYDVITPNLLHRDPFSYDQEEEAYHYFINEVGFNGPKDEVKQIVAANRMNYEKIYIIGFSVGATTAWICSEFEIDGVIGFYGSRIRDYVEMEPGCPTLLFFPESERSFHVPELIDKLKNKKNIHVTAIHAEHGFMNPFFRAYSRKDYMECMNQCLKFLKQLEEIDTTILSG
ncbi:dienelactone hydrolase family protein [Paenibacillus sp. A14]|uniref:dienelactone hydrolase family protein n=1 Tax=Paenibacillus sp. A14 TaxID=3119820 RepID=UPI002FE1F465